MSIRILLADDHTIVRHGLRETLEQEDDMEVVGEAESGLSAVQLTRTLVPDVVIMDISMPDINGIDATAQIVHDFPEIKAIALSMLSSKKFVSEMFKAGATAYLLKDCGYDELIHAVHLVVAGKTYLTPEIAGTVIDNYVRHSTKETSSAFSVLTRREREILQLMSEGQTTKEIGRKLHISPKTVESHRLRLMKKLEIDNVVQLTKYAIREGLTSP